MRHLVNMKKFVQPQQRSAAYAKAHDRHQIMLPGFDINWDEPALISQFYSGLQDGVKDLLLTLPDPSTLDEAINQAVKCDNCLFERRQDKRVWTTPHQPSEYSASSTSAHAVMYTEAEAMQIDVTRFKPLTEQEKKQRREENLCLYCGQPDH